MGTALIENALESSTTSPPVSGVGHGCTGGFSVPVCFISAWLNPFVEMGSRTPWAAEVGK